MLRSFLSGWFVLISVLCQHRTDPTEDTGLNQLRATFLPKLWSFTLLAPAVPGLAPFSVPPGSLEWPLLL